MYELLQKHLPCRELPLLAELFHVALDLLVNPLRLEKDVG